MGSTLPATFINPKLVTKIENSKVPIIFLIKQANVLRFGKAWYNEDQKVDIFGFASTAD